MIKVIDVDALFDEYIKDYVYGNVNKVKPEEIENALFGLYEGFGDTPLKDLDGKTPNEYYRSFGIKELLECLKSHVENGVSVSDFLCEAITSAENAEDAVIAQLNDDGDEEYMIYLLNVLAQMDSKKACKRYLDFVLWDYSETIRELATELLNGMADQVKEEILLQFREVDDEKRANLTEILSHASADDRVFDLLVEQFAKHQDEIPQYASYLSRYGDERALPFLLTAIENPKISYGDFKELQFVIEALGGEYKKERDFSSDATYKLIKGLKEEK